LAEDFEMLTYMMPSSVGRVNFMQKASEGIFDEISKFKAVSKIKSYKA